MTMKDNNNANFHCHRLLRIQKVVITDTRRMVKNGWQSIWQAELWKAER